MGSRTRMRVLFSTHLKVIGLSFFIGRWYFERMKSRSWIRIGSLYRIGVAILLIYSSPTHAADTQWRSGAAAIKITPQRPVLMSGYASRTRPFERVERDLFAKALALDDGAGHRAAIVPMDLIDLSATIAEPVAQRIAEKNNLKREQILLNFAHNHAGPILSLGTPEETDDPNPPRETVEYTRWMMDRLVEVANDAMSRLQPSKPS